MAAAAEKWNSAKTWDVVKTVGYIYLGYKALDIVSNLGPGSRTGGDSGTSPGTACSTVDTDELSYHELEYDAAADILEGALFGADAVVDMTEDDELAAATLMYMQNDDDVAMLICSYGKRGYGYVGNVQVGLPMIIADLLDDDDREDVNEDYEAKGITIRF